MFTISLLDKYRSFADEQVHFTRQLQENSLELEALTRNLQGSRQKIVKARKEERRRMGRDLHDGLGPLLPGRLRPILCNLRVRSSVGTRPYGVGSGLSARHCRFPMGVRFRSAILS